MNQRQHDNKLMAEMAAEIQAQVEADKRRHRRELISMVIRLVIALLIGLYLWAVTAKAADVKDFIGLRADYEEQAKAFKEAGDGTVPQVDSEALFVPDPTGYTVIVRRLGVTQAVEATYEGCTSLGSYSMNYPAVTAGYAYWTCSSWSSQEDFDPPSHDGLRKGLIILTDGETYTGCALVEEGWNAQRGYGFKTYYCD